MQRSEMKQSVVAQVGNQTAVAPEKKTIKRDKLLTIRLTLEERDAVNAFFGEFGVPAATGVRELILRHIRRQGG